jgi:hypothetical protein
MQEAATVGYSFAIPPSSFASVDSRFRRLGEDDDTGKRIEVRVVSQGESWTSIFRGVLDKGNWKEDYR